MSATAVRVEPAWLALREPADAAARSAELAGRAAAACVEHRRLVVHDLGCGTGAMGRWLAPRLPVRQHWVLHDHDAALLERAAADAPPGASVEARRSDLTRLTSDDLAGAGLVVASALLDLLTTDELHVLLDAWAHRCPLLVALTVVGRVRLLPREPLDEAVAAAFDAHQRRRGLLGPAAVPTLVGAVNGARVAVRSSPWRLGPAQRELAAAWLDGWTGAAVEQEPALAGPVAGYRERRLAQAAAGRLSVTVGHADVLVLP